MYSHQLQLYLNFVQEKYIRLYENLVTELKALLKSISILSRGYLPAYLFPPSTLKQLSEQAINMIREQNPDYVLALPHITDYYDMRLVTFGLDEEDRLIICFPIFIKEYKREPMILYQIETVKKSLSQIKILLPIAILRCRSQSHTLPQTKSTTSSWSSLN